MGYLNLKSEIESGNNWSWFLVSISIIILCVILISIMIIILRRKQNFFEKLKSMEGYRVDTSLTQPKGAYSNFNKEDEI